jgi:diguanylate cyclase (GGDEF)-like protein
MLVHKTDGLSAEDAFFLGLIHDLGILAFIHSMPAQYDVVMQHVRNSDYEFHEVEKMFLGITHMEMGYYLFQKWGFPEKFVVPICYHHDPEMIPQEKKHFSHNSQVLHFASMLSTFLYGANTTVSFSLVDYYFKTYGLDAQYDIEKIITQLQDQTSSIFPIFDVSLDEEYDYLSILEEARNYLITNSNEMTLYILEQKRNIDQLERLAFYDELTGLINYRKFFDLLEKELARAKRYDSYFCLCLSDIDLFKRVNDSYGHIVGDKVLKQVAGYLCDNLRMCDTIARYGGEEFAFIIPETHCEEALVVVERLREGISRSKFQIQGNSISLTMSFGLAEFKPDHDLSGEDVLSQADSALYDSKRSGRNRSAVYKPVYSMQEPHLENNAYGPKVL